MRTGLEIFQLPATPTLVKNQIITDPTFGSQMVRISDASDSPAPNIKTDTANCGSWNKNDTLFMAKATGGAPVLFQFVPAKMQAIKIPFTPPGPNAAYCFSSINAAVLYALLGSKVLRIGFSLVDGLWTQTASIATVCDFATILPTGFKVQWTSLFRVSQDDSTITAGLSEGVQDTDYIVCTFQSGHAGSTYRLLNTHTGAISGEWGSNGPATLISPKMVFPMLLHEVIQTPNDSYAVIDPVGQASQGIWTIGTIDINDPNISGHSAYGYSHLYDGGPGGGQIQEVEYSTLASRAVIPKNMLPANQSPPQQYQGDQHFAFGKVETDDQSIIWISSQSQASPFTSCWMNEIRGCRVLDGVVFRACHTFNSGLSADFDVANAMAIPSQTGNFVAFSTDWMKTWGGRGDVVVVNVKN